MISGLRSDLRHAFRLYLKTPWQSALALLMLATAMALVAAMANLWSDLHIGTTPGLENDRGLVTIGQRDRARGGLFSATVLEEFSETTQTLEHVSGAMTFNHLDIEDFADEPLRGNIEPVMAGYFETVQPIIRHGRGLVEEDFIDQGSRVLVLSHELWQERFDADPGLIGREVDIEGESWRIVGVMHEDFTGLFGQPSLFWVPWRRYFSDLQQSGMPEHMIDQFPFWKVVGRTAPGIGSEAVAAEIRQVIAQMPSPPFGRAPDPELVLVLDGLIDNPEAHAEARRQTTLLLISAVLVALVAAVNIGIFLLARAPARRRELALRQAVGAGRRRLAGQLLIEAAVLVVLATLAGSVLSIWLAALIREMRLFEQAGFGEHLLSVPAFAFAALLAALFTVLVAMVPIRLVRSRGLGQQSRQVSARPGPFQHVAGMIQLSLAGLVGAAAIAFLVHLWLMDKRDPGFQPDGVTVAMVSFRERPTGGFRMPPPETTASFRSELRETLLALPGVEQISFASPLPGQRMTAFGSFDIGGETVAPRMVSVGGGFAELMGLTVLHGEAPRTDDQAGIVVTREFARQGWGETDVIDRFLIEGDGAEPDERWRIIGVVEDVRYDHPDDGVEPIMFSATSGMVAGVMASVLVRGEVDGDALEARINEVLARHLDLLHVSNVQSLRELMAELTAADRARSLVTGLFGTVIVLMAGFGFFAMQRFLVDAGMRETAIRMALGAGPKLTRRQVLIQALWLGLPGLLIGSLLALVTTAWLTDDLITDQVPAVAVAATMGGLLLVLLLTASVQPALRAARLRPGALLKEE